MHLHKIMGRLQERTNNNTSGSSSSTNRKQKIKKTIKKKKKRKSEIKSKRRKEVGQFEGQCPLDAASHPVDSSSSMAAEFGVKGASESLRPTIPRHWKETIEDGKEGTSDADEKEDRDSLFISSCRGNARDKHAEDDHQGGSRLNCDSLALHTGASKVASRQEAPTKLAQRDWPLAVGLSNLFSDLKSGDNNNLVAAAAAAAAAASRIGRLVDCTNCDSASGKQREWHKRNKFHATTTTTETIGKLNVNKSESKLNRRLLATLSALSGSRSTWPALICATTCLLHLMLLSSSIVSPTSALVINVNYARRQVTHTHQDRDQVQSSNQSINAAHSFQATIESNDQSVTNRDGSSSWRHKRAAVSSSSSSLLSPKVHNRANNSDSDDEAAITSSNSHAGGRSSKLLELDALNYLQRYGYMNTSGQQLQQANGGSNALNLISEDSFHEAIMQFQRFAGIPETGTVDSLTVKYMQMPRCGNKDLSGKGENGKRKRRRRKRKRKRRKKRYALQGSKWRRQELTYRISQYPTRFLNKKHEVDGQIERAFKIWSQVAPIDFVVKKEGRVHIDIRFASGEHGDGDPFDGPGNTLAHAYFPQYGGDAHFDDQEYWTVDSYTGTNIFQVAAHELGHSLGLGHSSVREALMAPFYQKYKPNFKLHADDVLGIQALYGERSDDDDGADDKPTSSSTTSTTTSTTTTETSVARRWGGGGGGSSRPSDDPDRDEGGFFGGGGGGKPVDLCQDSRIDTITRTEDGSTYVFRGQYYWQIKNEGLASGYPAKISRDWDGLPGNLDAALTWSDGKTFFFKGDKYWRFFNKRREPGYPKLISVGFAGVPNNLDAAFVWSGNGKTYFFKRDKYWRFDSKQEPPVSGQYPKPIKNWSGLPTSGLDAAFKWDNGMTYFFKDDVYYRFDDREFEVDSSARPAFPRSTAEWWFGCTNSNLPIRRRPGQAANEAAAGADLGAADSELASSSVLMFHKKPVQSYDTIASNKPSTTTTAATTASSSSQNQQPSTSTSISRSIINSLSALFPSSLTGSSTSPSSTPAPSPSSTQSSESAALEDWSFHRGLGEEVRRLFKSARSQGEHGTYDPDN